MSIATAITAAQGKVADCYTAISNKGGTLPATQNLANMPTAINSIPSGGGGSTKYGCKVDNFLGDVDANGVYKAPTSGANVVFTGVKQIGTSLYTGRSLAYCFYNGLIESVSFPDLESIVVANGMSYCFYLSTVSSVSFPKLKIISGSNALSHAFNNCYMVNIDFPELEEITGGTAFAGCFYGPAVAALDNLEKCYFTKLFNVSAPNIFSNCFYTRRKLTDIYFNALTATSFGSYVNQFQNMFDGTTGSTATGGCTVHFPSNLLSTISGLTGYPTFGGNSSYIHLAFDLPSTS